MKYEDMKISFVEEFDYDETDFNLVSLTINEFGQIENWPRYLFNQIANDCVEILRAPKFRKNAKGVPTSASEKSPGTS
jgi:predicted ATPase